ncbi:4Fe-4S dicluster domain-containing protein [Desulforhabdus amnigena]|jgi:heterodisulfide reductase subunit C|uniref:Heterodisulfide reductase subunit C n=1 Tax=Desulforhabdus amnigena TaxID=40218 RepID=A0A9W6FVG4_9BACT|nr:4Fe-4S dicluster domain-containing protein [Desulforhabdus amnigena]NLJ29494.1 heterodisulfide reductase subunit C-like protein [Deltaproteobacteria bacterium]GLI35690.1 hypothetical protein DAMNIGENAA_31230 [Desulforhabdus amnigena]
MISEVLEYKPDTNQSFLEEVMERSGQNLLACYQCRRCAAGCPVGDETQGVTPDRLIRMILLGDRDQALENLLVWRCVSCYTCGTRCPNNIQTARINETLKQMSKERHLDPLSTKVAAFHSAFTTATGHFGRLNELEFMGMYELQINLKDLKNRNFKGLYQEMKEQAELGLTMKKNRRLHFGLQKVKGLDEIRRLYKKAKLKKADRVKVAEERGGR